MSAAAYNLPPKPPFPGPLATGLFLSGALRRYPRLRRRFGDAYRLRLPSIGQTVIVSNPELVKQVFTAAPDVVYGGENPLSKTLGPYSSFSLDEDDHLRQRRLLLPPFHGERMAGYGEIFEEEALREIATWPEGEDFPTLQPMMRITLNAILRTVFGVAEGPEFDSFRRWMPGWVKLGSALTALPWAQRDLGRWSPWARFLKTRKVYDSLVRQLIEKGLADPNLSERGDVLALLLQARYEDGTAMTREELSDQLLSLLVAGHETTAGSLAWTVERLRRNPAVLARLVEEVREGGSELREATIREVQRTRPVIAGTGRTVKKPFELGEWRLAPGMAVFVDGAAMHYDSRLFDRPKSFDPDRFVGRKPETYEWVPYGGGRRRCVGAAFAHLEMDVVLRTLLSQVELLPTGERGESWRFRGVAFAPSRGGLAQIRHRRTPLVAADDQSPAEAVPAAA